MLNNKDHTGNWRYIEGLPFRGTNLQNSMVIFDNYILAVGENGDDEKEFYYFDVETEKWFDAAGEMDPSIYSSGGGGGGGGVPGALCKSFNIHKKFLKSILQILIVITLHLRAYNSIAIVIKLIHTSIAIATHNSV